MNIVIAALGLTLIITVSDIMNPVRRMLDRLQSQTVTHFVRCSQCVGFWCGLFVTAAAEWHSGVGSYDFAVLCVLNALTVSCLGIFANYSLSKLSR